MSALSIQPTFPIFTETNGLPLENGYIWIGAANLDPQGNPISVYWDAALTIPAGQPIRTLNGYPSRSGTPARLYVNSDYSIRVQNSKGSLVYGAPEATERYGNIITLTSLGIPSVTDYGAVGDGVTDDTVAINIALATGQALFFPEPSAFYKITAPINFPTPFTAGRYKVFDSSAVVTFAAGTVNQVLPEWFGADPSGATDSKAAIEAAIKSAYGDARLPVYFNGEYRMDTGILFSNKYGFRLVSDRYATIDVQYLPYSSAYGGNAFSFSGCQDVVIDGLRFYGNSTSAAAYDCSPIGIDDVFNATGSSYITVQNCVFDQIKGYGIHATIGGAAPYGRAGQSKWTINNNKVYVAGYAGYNYPGNDRTGFGNGMDIFSIYDINTYYVDQVVMSNNTFYVANGYLSNAFKVQGAINSSVTNNLVVGGSITSTSAYIELYMKDSTFSNNALQVTGTTTPGIRTKGCVNTTMNDCRISTTLVVREAYEVTGDPTSSGMVLDNIQVDAYGATDSDIANADGLVINDCKFAGNVGMGASYSNSNYTFQNVTVMNSSAAKWDFSGRVQPTGEVNYVGYNPGLFVNPSNPATSIPVSASTNLEFDSKDALQYTVSANTNFYSSTLRVPPAGTVVTLVLVTSGTTPRTVQFTQGFGYVAPFSTGTTSGAIFTFRFISDGAVMQSLGYTDNTDLATLGAELITNGDFSSATGWTLESGWSIGGGLLTGATASTLAYQGVGSAGNTYEITYTVVSRTAGFVRAICCGNTGQYITEPGTYTERILAFSGTEIGLTGTGFSGTIDNFSAKLVTY